MMRAGDFDGDGADEVAVLPIRGQAQDVCFFKGPKLAQTQGHDLQRRDSVGSGEAPVARTRGENFRKGKQTWSGLSLKKANGTVADLDGDGAAELIYSPGVYTLKGGLRQRVRPARHLQDRQLRLATTTCGCSRPATSPTEPGAEIVLVEGPQVRLYDSTGKELGGALRRSDSPTSSICPARRAAACCSAPARTATTISIG